MGTGNVVLRADTGATVTAEGKWHYRSPGVIDVIRPDSGVRGTHVTLQGNGLLGGGTSVASVTLAGVSAAVVSETDSEIVVEAMPAKGTDAEPSLLHPTRVLPSSTKPGLNTSRSGLSMKTASSPLSGKQGHGSKFVGLECWAVPKAFHQRSLGSANSRSS